MKKPPNPRPLSPEGPKGELQFRFFLPPLGEGCHEVTVDTRDRKGADHITMGEKMIDKQQLIDAIREAFKMLMKNDSVLLCRHVEENEEAIKLHEVCINHKLANYFEETIFLLLTNHGEGFFTDIEFNKEGKNKKKLLRRDGKEKDTRPDIIIHNRKSGAEKENILIVECKKDSNSQTEIDKDVDKIIAFITGPKYEYKFGLQVIYAIDGVSGILFFKQDDEGIGEIEIIV